MLDRMNRQPGSRNLLLAVAVLLTGATMVHGADCSGWSVDRNHLGTPERDHGSLRITTDEGVWQWRYGSDRLLELYAVAQTSADVSSREKKLTKFKKRFTSKYGEPRTTDPYEEATEEDLQVFLVADQRGTGTDRWLEGVSRDSVWFSEDCNAHVSLYRGFGNDRYYVVVLLRPIRQSAGN